MDTLVVHTPLSSQVKVVATKASQHMMGVASDYAPERVATFEASGIPVLTDEDEWKDYGKGGFVHPSVHRGLAHCASAC